MPQDPKDRGKKMSPWNEGTHRNCALPDTLPRAACQDGCAGGWIPPVPALERRRDLRRCVAPRDEDLCRLRAPGT